MKDQEVCSKIMTPRDLVYLIVDRCAGNILDHSTIEEDHLQFVEFFNKTISELVGSQIFPLTKKPINTIMPKRSGKAGV